MIQKDFRHGRFNKSVRRDTHWKLRSIAEIITLV